MTAHQRPGAQTFDIPQEPRNVQEQHQILVTLNGIVFTSRPIGPAEVESTKRWLEKTLPYNVITVVDL